MAEIKIEFPDGSVKPFGAGVTVLEIAKSIGTSLAKNAVAGKVNDELVNLDQPLDQDGKVEIITKDSEDGQLVNWNSAALVLTSAIKSIYPEIRIGEIGNIEHGFYADTDKEGQQISVDELPAIEDKMKDMIQAKVALSHEMLSVEDALAKVDSDPYQAKLVKKNAKDGKVNVYDVDGSLIVSDCVALPDASGLKAIKLLSVAGAYWEGKSSNPMLQRI